MPPPVVPTAGTTTPRHCWARPSCVTGPLHRGMALITTGLPAHSVGQPTGSRDRSGLQRPSRAATANATRNQRSTAGPRTVLTSCRVCVSTSPTRPERWAPTARPNRDAGKEHRAGESGTRMHTHSKRCQMLSASHPHEQPQHRCQDSEADDLRGEPDRALRLKCRGIPGWVTKADARRPRPVRPWPGR
jgi:hypothetical protein